MKAGEQFAVTLEANPTTGYRWRLSRPLDSKMLKFRGQGYMPIETELVGSGGIEVWVFKALRRGKTILSFEYVRQWEKGEPPVATRDITIFIK